MAAVSRPLIHQDGDPMTKAQNSLTPVAEQPGRGPACVRVRVRVRHGGANPAKIYPPDGERNVSPQRSGIPPPVASPLSKGGPG